MRLWRSWARMSKTLPTLRMRKLRGLTTRSHLKRKSKRRKRIGQSLQLHSLAIYFSPNGAKFHLRLTLRSKLLQRAQNPLQGATKSQKMRDKSSPKRPHNLSTLRAKIINLPRKHLRQHSLLNLAQSGAIRPQDRSRLRRMCRLAGASRGTQTGLRRLSRWHSHRRLMQEKQRKKRQLCPLSSRPANGTQTRS